MLLEVYSFAAMNTEDDLLLVMAIWISQDNAMTLQVWYNFVNTLYFFQNFVQRIPKVIFKSVNFRLSVSKNIGGLFGHSKHEYYRSV